MIFVKKHIFFNIHRLDHYEELGEPVEYKRFDPDLQQALSWKRLTDGVASLEDREWLDHEFQEQKYELENNAGYRESHAYAQKLYNGNPWTDEWDEL